MKRLIALTLALATLILSCFCLFACTEPAEGDEEGQEIENGGGDMLVGVVTEGPKYTYFMMQTNGGIDYRVNISDETTVISKTGESIAYTDIKKGDHIKLTHTGTVTRSIPPQITATRIEIVGAQTTKSLDGAPNIFSMRARVKSIDPDEGMRVEVISSDYAQGDYYFYVSEDTIVYDGTGAVVAFSYVQVGDVVNVTYGEAVTLSLPPKTNAIRIDVE